MHVIAHFHPVIKTVAASQISSYVQVSWQQGAHTAHWSTSKEHHGSPETSPVLARKGLQPHSAIMVT